MEKEKQMGFVYVKIGIAKLTGKDFKYYTGLIGTGATKTLIPASVAKELGIEKGEAKEVRTGNGPALLYTAAAKLEVEGIETTSEIWISDKMSEVIIGVTTLELIGLSVDPKSGTLKKEEFLLYNIAKIN